MWVCVCVRVWVGGCVWKEKGSPGRHARLAVARSPGKKKPHDVLPHPRQGAISRGGRRGGRELANRGAVVNAAASRQCCSISSRALASEKERERERERGGRKRGRRVEPRTDHADLTRCPTTVSTHNATAQVLMRVYIARRTRSFVVGRGDSARTTARCAN